MAAGENVVVGTNYGGLTLARRAVDGDTFTDGIPVANLQPRDAAFPFQILRSQTEAGERENLIVPAERRVAVNDDMRVQFAMVAENDVFTDDAIRADFAARTDLRPGMNDCR
jgi:hypothetical protein